MLKWEHKPIHPGEAVRFLVSAMRESQASLETALLASQHLRDVCSMDGSQGSSAQTPSSLSYVLLFVHSCSYRILGRFVWVDSHLRRLLLVFTFIS